MPLFNPPAAYNAGALAKTAKMLWGPCAAGLHGHVSDTMQQQPANSVNSGIAFIGQAPHAGLLNRIGVNVAAIGGAPPAFNIGFVTLDASLNPTLTPAGASALATFVPAAGFTWITLPTGLTVVAGQLICARIWPGATAPDATNNATFNMCNNLAQHWLLPHVKSWTGTVWTLNSQPPAFGVRYQLADGDDVIGQSVGMSSAASATFTNATNPDTRGGKFQVPLPMACIGAQVHVCANTLAMTMDVRLYDGANNLLATASLPANLSPSTSNFYLANVYWPAVNLAANTDYRLVCTATSVDTRSLVEVVQSDAAAALSEPEGSRWQLTTRQAAGAWTDTPTTMPMLGLWVSAITG